MIRQNSASIEIQSGHAMLHFSPIITRQANEYFFLQNLSGWSQRTRHPYNELWRKQLGPFPLKVDKQLAVFARVHKRYPFGPTYLGRPFFVSQKPLSTLRSLLRPQEHTIVKAAFDGLRPFFNKIYRQDCIGLQAWRRLLNQRLNHDTVSKKLFTDLAVLYRAKPLIQRVRIHLLLSGRDSTGGQANLIDQQTILVECSRFPLAGVHHITGIVWHEVIHLGFEQQHFVPLLQQTLRHREIVQRVKEATATALLPRGALARRLQPKKKSFTYDKRSQRLATKLSGYLQRGRPLDEEYVRWAARVLKEKGPDSNAGAHDRKNRHTPSSPAGA